MEIKQIAAALVRAQQAFAPALKTSTNPHFRSKYADLASCVEAVIDALNANGIFLMQPTQESDNGVTVSTVFLHESGEQLSAGTLFVPAAKQDAQGYGSALTYARRYSLMSACGIAPEDDDGNAATRASANAKTERQRIIEVAADKAIALFKNGDEVAAYEEISGIIDNEEKLYLWGYLKPHSALRAAIKRLAEEDRKK